MILSICKQKFYSLLRGKEKGDKEYKHALKVWGKFKMKTMKRYHSCT